MKFLPSTSSTAFLLLLATTTAGSSSSTTTMTTVRPLFMEWMQEFGKEYASGIELLDRMAIWRRNHLFIEHSNKQTELTYKLGHNQFSDMSWNEYKSYNKLGEYSPGVLSERTTTSSSATFDFVGTNDNEIPMHNAQEARNLLLLSSKDNTMPDEINWVDNGAVPAVKNQGMCGSCWAFSAIGAIEGKHFLDTGSLVALSEQQLVDCDSLDMGCSGGLMDNAFLFDENSTGICSEEEYPYVQHKRWFRGCASAKGYCTGVNHTRVQSFIDVPNTAHDLMAALAEQPVSVAIEADKQSFQFYKSGVYADPECGNNLDHGVLAVGYGTEGEDYFLVRNSWGATWGDEGYIKLARNNPAQVNGTCGILQWASRPLLRDDFD